MALVAHNPDPPHTGVYLPPKVVNSDQIWDEIGRKKKDYVVPQHVKEFYDKAHGGHQSFTDRTIKIYVENSDECLSIGAKVSTTVKEVRDLLGMFLQTDPNNIIIKRKTGSFVRVQKATDECPSTVFVGGVRSFKRTPKQYEHPILVVGAGLGGIQCMVDLINKGRTDIVCMDRNEDFGGWSWLKVPNKFTKLQTERGTYSVEYILPDAPIPSTVMGGTHHYATWPSRDQLLSMMREGAAKWGLYSHTMFNTGIEKVTPKGDAYAIQYLPTVEDGDAGILLSCCVNCYPGFLHDPNQVEFPGEEDFGGYIEYSSFDKLDYEQVTGKKVFLYGHGAFTIENVRTLVEHRCPKVWVVCRTRNLSGTKITSWLIGTLDRPIPATVLVDSLKRMYDLVGYDPWTCYSVHADAERTTCTIDQKTIFGVTDIYFLAGYYGLMECVIDEVKRVTHHCIHTKAGRKFELSVFIKAIGTKPSFKVDKQMCIKELVGFWVNGDPKRPIFTGTKGVQAKNFGSFSIGPGLAPIVKIMNYFIDFPDDWRVVEDSLPRNKAGAWPAYVHNAAYGMPVFMTLQVSLPTLAQQINEAGALKVLKQRQAHPMDQFLGQCREEWEAYIRFFKKHNMIDDRPDCPYPYTEEVIWHLVDKCNRSYNGETIYADP